MIVWAIRHGEIKARGRCIGWTDLELSAPQQTRRALSQLSAPLSELKHIYCSDLERARHTAEILAELCQGAPEVVPDARLRELHFGAWEGLTWAQIERLDEAAYWRFMNAWRTTRAPGGESYEGLCERVAAWHSELYESATLVVVAHHSSLRALAELSGHEDGFSLSWAYAQARPLHLPRRVDRRGR